MIHVTQSAMNQIIDLFNRRKRAIGLDKYSVGDILDHGGMSNIYTVSDGSGDADYVLRVSEEHKSPYSNDIFNERELKILQELKKNSQPHVVQYLDAFVANIPGYPRYYCAVMKFLSTLKQYRVKGDGVEIAVRLGSDFLPLLQSFTDKEILHRDIKPANIFYDADFRNTTGFLLGDFGIAKHDSDTSVTPTGTESTMAPEVRGLDRSLGSDRTRSDMYSLGIVMYRYLNEGIYPSNRERIDRMPPDKAPFPSPRFGSRRLKELVLKATSYYPNDRFDSPQDMLRELQKCEEYRSFISHEDSGSDETVNLEELLEAENKNLQSQLKQQKAEYEAAVESLSLREKKLTNELEKIKEKALRAEELLTENEALKEQALRAEELLTENEALKEQVLRAEELLTENEALKEQVLRAEELLTENEALKEKASRVEELLTENEALKEKASRAEELLMENEALKEKASREEELLTENEALKEQVLRAEELLTENEALKEQALRAEELLTENEALKEQALRAEELLTENEALKERIAAREKELLDEIEMLKAKKTSQESRTRHKRKSGDPLDLRVGDKLRYGAFPQGSKGEIQPLMWRVLAVEKDKALIITEQLIDTMQYNSFSDDITWEKCSLRFWLNNTFITSAFGGSLPRRVMVTTNDNPDNPKHGTEGGAPTEDKVFLISVEEAEKYFKDNADRMAGVTEYAQKQGAWVSNDYLLPNGEKAGLWWLRSPGYISHTASRVLINGDINSHGGSIVRENVAVRPAMWISTT